MSQGNTSTSLKNKPNSMYLKSASTPVSQINPTEFAYVIYIIKTISDAWKTLPVLLHRKETTLSKELGHKEKATWVRPDHSYKLQKESLVGFRCKMVVVETDLYWSGIKNETFDTI